MKQNISNDDIKQAIEDHWALQLGSYFSSVHDLDGAIYNLGDTVTDYYWNYAGRIETTDDALEGLIDRILKFAENHERQPAFYLDPTSRPKRVARALESRGFKSEDEEIWMFYPVGRESPPAQETLPSLKIKTVDTDAEFDDFISVFHDAYGMLEEGHSRSPYGDSLIAARKNPPANVKITHLIGYVGAEAVSIASTYQVGSVAGLYNVGTPEGQRKKGYGAALSNAAIDVALKAGAKKLMLQTGLDSPAHRLYARLGFALGFTAVIWSRPE